MTEPRTEAGRKLLGDYVEDDLSPEDEAWFRDCILTIEAEAAAGPRDLHCARCDARIELRHYDYPQHVRDHIPVAEAAAGPRDEGLDVERLARAMREHIASIRKDNDDSPCVEQCARDIARRYEAAAGPLTPKEYERLTTFTSDDWAAKREAEAAAGPREGLDVERLAKAIDIVTDDDYAANRFRGSVVLARELAREYAALAKASE